MKEVINALSFSIGSLFFAAICGLPVWAPAVFGGLLLIILAVKKLWSVFGTVIIAWLVAIGFVTNFVSPLFGNRACEFIRVAIAHKGCLAVALAIGFAGLVTE